MAGRWSGCGSPPVAEHGSGRLRVVIADDEPIARRGLERLLRAERDVEVQASCANGREALAAIRTHRPDIAFLDVAMPKMTGIEVVRELPPTARPAVVFVTAFDRFAIDAFDLHAVDYLLKPFDAERFRTALDRTRQRLRGSERTDRRLDDLLEAWTQRHRAPEQLSVRHGDRIIVIAVSSIDWIDADDNYARLNAVGKQYFVRETMRALEQRLRPAGFARIHRSTIVNLSRVAELRPLVHGEYQVTLRDGTHLTLSRSYRDAILARLGATG
jgi:two-component system, LytTR family, response regulator